MRLIRLVLALLVIAVLVVFALSNREPVVLSFLGYDAGAPLSVAILACGAVAFLLGAVALWFAELRQRARARRAEHRVALLERELAALRPPAPAPTVGVLATEGPAAPAVPAPPAAPAPVRV